MEPCGAPLIKDTTSQQWPSHSDTLRSISEVAQDPTTCLLQKPYIKKLRFKDIMVDKFESF